MTLAALNAAHHQFFATIIISVNQWQEKIVTHAPMIAALVYRQDHAKMWTPRIPPAPARLIRLIAMSAAALL